MLKTVFVMPPIYLPSLPGLALAAKPRLARFQLAWTFKKTQLGSETALFLLQIRLRVRILENGPAAQSFITPGLVLIFQIMARL